MLTGANSLHKDDWGFVYLIGHHCMPGVFKIGRTERSPMRRLAELGSPTGVPGPFSMIFYVESWEHCQLERRAHAAFSHCRIDSGREFFRFDGHDMADLLRWFDQNAGRLFVVDEYSMIRESLQSVADFSDLEAFDADAYTFVEHAFIHLPRAARLQGVLQ